MTDELNDEPTIQEPTDNLPETEGLLRDIDAPVVIELGRLKMNTAQVNERMLAAGNYSSSYSSYALL